MCIPMMSSTARDIAGFKGHAQRRYLDLDQHPELWRAGDQAEDDDLKVLTPTSYTMKFEVSMDGTNWMTFMDGKATKK